MAVRVVHELEVVEIHQQHGQRSVVAAYALHLRHETDRQRATVHELSERIRLRKRLESMVVRARRLDRMRSLDRRDTTLHDSLRELHVGCVELWSIDRPAQ